MALRTRVKVDEVPGDIEGSLGSPGKKHIPHIQSRRPPAWFAALCTVLALLALSQWGSRLTGTQTKVQPKMEPAPTSSASHKPLEPAVPVDVPEVRYLWQGSVASDGSPRPSITWRGKKTGPGGSDFFVLDVYRMQIPAGYDPSIHDASDLSSFRPEGRAAADLNTVMMVMGEGTIEGMSFPTKLTYETDLKCIWQAGGGLVETIPMIQFMRFKQGQIDYRPQNNKGTTMSNNHDNYKTQYILCPLPADEHASLVRLRSANGDWKVELGNAVPVSSPPTTAEATTKRRLTVCMAPMYGSGNIRWMIEYLEYHRAMGVEHVDIPVWEYEGKAQAAPLWQLLRRYKREGFVTLRHWGVEASHGYTNDGKVYERAKYLAWDDCWLRNRGVSDWLVNIDIDEVISGGRGSVQAALDFCDAAFHKDDKVGCALTSHTMISVFKKVGPYTESGKLLLEEYDYGESAPRCPYNCGEFHRGRQKYMVRAGEAWIPPMMMWTHAINGQDYTHDNTIMVQVPADTLRVHHYQGWWYTTDEGMTLVPDGLIKGGGPVPAHLIAQIKAALSSSPELKKTYLDSPGRLGVTWVKPLVHEVDGKIVPLIN